MEPIDHVIRAAAPRAPGGLGDAVARRLDARRRARRVLAAGAFVTAAMLVLWWLL